MQLTSPALLTPLRAGALCAVLAVGLSACGGSSSASSSAASPDSSTAAATTSTSSPSTGAPAGAAQTLVLNVVEGADGTLGFDKSSLTAKAGNITIQLKNGTADLKPHAIAIRGNGADASGQVVQPGGDSTLTADVKAGTYTYYCPVGHHEQGGMTGTLTVG